MGAATRTSSSCCRGGAGAPLRYRVIGKDARAGGFSDIIMRRASEQYLIPPTSTRSREQLRRTASQPIDQKADPFAGGGIGAFQAGGQAGKRPQRIPRPTGAPVDRIGLDRKAGGTKDPHGTRHVIARGDEQPTLSRLRHGQQERED